MITVPSLYLFEELHSPLEVLIGIGTASLCQTEVPQGHHQLAVGGIFLLQVTIPDEEVWQRDGKIIHTHLVKDVLLSVVQELVTEAVGLVVLA